MIEKPLKYIFLGPKKELDSFFFKAQEKGFIEFIDPAARKLELSDAATEIVSAIKILKRRELREQKENPSLHVSTIAKKTIHTHESIEKLEEKKRLLQGEITRISIFGDFRESDIQYIEKEGRRFIQFFSLKSSKTKDIDFPKEVIYVGTDYDLDYFIAINKEKRSYPGLIEIHVEKPVGILKAHLSLVEKEIKNLEELLKEYSSYFNFLEEGLKEALNSYHLVQAKNSAEFLMYDALFSISGWISSSKIKELEEFIQPFSVHAEEVQIDERDRPPTCMENEGFSKVGEDLVAVYDIPSIGDKDPSSWVIWAFALFYAMIVADAGYGLLYLLGALFLYWKFPKWSGALKRLRSLILSLGIFAVVWGVLTASFFGIEVGPDSPLRKASLIHYLARTKAEYHIRKDDDTYQEWVEKFPNLKGVEDGHEFLKKAVSVRDGKPKFEALDDFYDSILMEFSLLVGAIHITIAFLRYLRRNWSGLGWIIALIGGYLFFPAVVHSTSMINFTSLLPKEIAHPLGEYLLYGGMSLATLSALIQKRLGGLHELMNVIQIFADILSYLRLYALGLAGMIMADTFNQIGLSMGLWVGGILVIFIGHAINIVLGIMGGVIHSLRLNFLEWYHYCFEGGGRLFNPLRKI